MPAFVIWTPPVPPPPPTSVVQWRSVLVGRSQDGSRVGKWMDQRATFVKSTYGAVTGLLLLSMDLLNHTQIPVTGALRAALLGQGAAWECVGLNFGRGELQQEMVLLFSSDITPRAWYCENIGHPTPTWVPATGLPAGDGVHIAGGLGANDALVALTGPATRFTEDGSTFGSAGVPNSAVNRLLSESGQQGVYLAAATGGVLKTIDAGAAWGYVRPHAGLGTGWPAGADALDIAFLPAPLPPAAAAPVITVGTTLYRVLTEGNVWESVNGAAFGTNANLLRYYGDGLLLHMTDDEGGIRVSEDSGETWITRFAPAPAEHFRSFDVSTGGRLWGLGKKTSGTDTGYLFYSDNLGLTWTLATSWPIALEVGHVAVNPQNSNQIAASFLFGSGDTRVRVSTNGGASWTDHVVDTASVFSPQKASGRLHWLSNRLVIIYQLTSNQAISRYSDDAGATWSAPSFDINLGISGVHDAISGSPFGPLFVAFHKSPETATAVILRSTTHGQTWDLLDSPFGALVEINSLAYDVLNDRLFVLGEGGVISYIEEAANRAASSWTAGAFLGLPATGVTPTSEGMALVVARN